MHRINRKDFLGGGLMLLLGLGAAFQASHYEFGTLRRMGPGYFPLALGLILALTGLAILLGSLRGAAAVAAARLAPEWRGWICICAGVASFAVIGRWGGLLPATFASVFLAALGDRKNTPVAAGVLAAVMTLVCLVVFWWLLKIELPLFRWG
ncbi:MAG: tripartite tricarboxylate transporter TctB family protein [Proteobacteria bacterium]|nr:tripartite tricarboxylate transporter TctB family protein [Pseudomonadota bacterium]